MAFQPSIITEHLTNAINVPWATAPAPVQAAAAAADKAISAHMDASAALEDATIGVPMADAAFDVAGKAAVRAGKPLPSRDGPDSAKFALQIAQEDLRVAERKMSSARGALAGLLNDRDTRDAWRANLEPHSLLPRHMSGPALHAFLARLTMWFLTASHC